MKYNLYELADNKELCKEVIEKKFTIKTSIDSLKALDFANLSMRQNHIKAYEEMYEIGGKELFDAILEDGKTSLTKNPNAAKVGVVPVNGADGFYLKSNVSALVAFMSIINGLKLLDKADGIYFQDEEDEQEDWEPLFQLDEFEDDEDNAGDEEDEQDDWEPLFELDEDEDSAEFEDGDEPEEVEENEEDDEDMKKDTIPQAKDYSVVGSKIIDNKTGEEVKIQLDEYGYATETPIVQIGWVEDEKNWGPLLGYKYQIEGSKKWGFISKSFLNVTPPLYDDFFVLDSECHQNRIIAFANGMSYNNDKLMFSNECVVKFGDEEQTEYQFEMSDTSKKMLYVDQYSMRPTPETKIYEHETDKGKGILYIPKGRPEDDKEDWDGVFLYQAKGKNFAEWGVTFNRFKGTISGIFSDQSSSWNRSEGELIPANEFKVELCCHAVEHINNGFFVVDMLGTYAYGCIVKKDGYFGFAELEFKNDTKNHNLTWAPGEGYRISRWLSPCAFTGYVETEEIGDYYIVDQFGKKGVFYWNRAVEGNPELAYVIPCEYEKIEYRPNGGYNDEFYVEKAGMAGCIICSNYGRDTKWSTPLHRIEE